MALTQVQGGMLQGSTNTTTTIQSNGTTAITIDSSQRVGIGTASPTGKLHVYGSGEVQTLQRSASNVNNYTLFKTESGADQAYLGFSDSGVNNFAIFNVQNGYVRIATNNTERMRIASTGELLVNSTTLNNGAQINVYGNNTLNGTYEWASPKGSNNSHMHYGTTGDWYIRPASNSGKVYVLNYQAESDERLKKDIAPITYGLNEIQQLQPRQFRWKEGDDSEVNGFIAQEVEAVIPTLVSEGQWKSVDYQGITAILVKAIQELKAELDATKAEVAALKAAP